MYDGAIVTYAGSPYPSMVERFAAAKEWYVPPVIFVNIYIYLYIYIYMCVCVCV